MDYKTGFILLAGFLYATTPYAQLKDPTKPASYTPKTIKKPQGKNKVGLPTLQLSSIWISDRFKRVTINGVTAKQGELILSNVRIVKILNDSVIIKQNGKSRKLYLLTHASNLRKTAF